MGSLMKYGILKHYIQQHFFFFSSKKQYFIGIVKPKNINPVIIYWPSCRSKYVQLSSFVKNLLFTIVTSIFRQREQDIVSNILTFQTWSMKSASGICMLATFLDMRDWYSQLIQVCAEELREHPGHFGRQFRVVAGETPRLVPSFREWRLHM